MRFDFFVAVGVQEEVANRVGFCSVWSSDLRTESVDPGIYVNAR